MAVAASAVFRIGISAVRAIAASAAAIAMRKVVWNPSREGSRCGLNWMVMCALTTLITAADHQQLREGQRHAVERERA
ncbi:hypothetical protein IU470_14505 [Nocardia abscessus]|uniref:Secreted protein n=1 Tax=Nocardia abscessus TaxID=120957 RepID=A0ABS0C9X0_9NOCA|nr:hypothetical protein [Nocardia abscessus]MBF6226308.1 hypothetical protein [Nocardia abscessus]